MSSREHLLPVRMQRIALVAPVSVVDEMLARVGDAGVVELEPSDTEPDRAAELIRRRKQAVSRGPITGITAWAPEPELPRLTRDLTDIGASAVPLAAPRGVQPPTLLQRERAATRAFDPLVQGYATVPYADVDPTLLAGLAYVAMFGMMFGDLGHGLLIVIVGVLLRSRRVPALRRFYRAWPFFVGGGVAASAFGVLYGEFFGPSGLLPVVWLYPLDQPVPLLVTAVGVGAALLAGSYVLGTVNRVREGGWRYALYARSGVAGSLLFLSLGLLAAGAYFGHDALIAAGAGSGIVALVLAFVGLLATAGNGGAGVVQASVELFDLVIRLGSNIVSFARLAAFGLTHAALAAVVWDGTTAVWGPGLAALGAIVLFLIGNAVALTLEALVAGIQALRLEYYELFSRVFDVEGRPFRAWRLPTGSAPDGTGTTEVST